MGLFQHRFLSSSLPICFIVIRIDRRLTENLDWHKGQNREVNIFLNISATLGFCKSSNLDYDYDYCNKRKCDVYTPDGAPRVLSHQLLARLSVYEGRGRGDGGS